MPTTTRLHCLCTSADHLPTVTDIRSAHSWEISSELAHAVTHHNTSMPTREHVENVESTRSWVTAASFHGISPERIPHLDWIFSSPDFCREACCNRDDEYVPVFLYLACPRHKWIMETAITRKDDKQLRDRLPQNGLLTPLVFVMPACTGLDVSAGFPVQAFRFQEIGRAETEEDENQSEDDEAEEHEEEEHEAEEHEEEEHEEEEHSVNHTAISQRLHNPVRSTVEFLRLNNGSASPTPMTWNPLPYTTIASWNDDDEEDDDERGLEYESAVDWVDVPVPGDMNCLVDVSAAISAGLSCAICQDMIGVDSEAEQERMEERKEEERKEEAMEVEEKEAQTEKKAPQKQIASMGVCDHIFHRECVGLWLKERNTCPLCRTIVDSAA